MWRKIRLHIAAWLVRRYGFKLVEAEPFTRARNDIYDLRAFVLDESGHLSNGYKGVRRVVRDLSGVYDRLAYSDKVTL